MHERVLYFDIDGVILTHDDTPKASLCKGNLQRVIQTVGFTRLVCVSGWVDMLRNLPPIISMFIFRSGTARQGACPTGKTGRRRQASTQCSQTATVVSDDHNLIHHS